MSDQQKPQRFELKSIQLCTLKPDGTIEYKLELLPGAELDFTPDKDSTEIIHYVVPTSITITAKANFRDVLRVLYPGWLTRWYASVLQRFAGRN
jgi:hypothetical protein